MKIINGKDFDTYWKTQTIIEEDIKTETAVKKIIAAVQKKGDAAVRKYAGKFDKSSPQKLEIPLSELQKAYNELKTSNPELTEALELAAENLVFFSKKQREQFFDFETETQPGVFTGQKIIPVERAAVYAPGGLYPLISSVLMALIPAFTAGVEEVFFSSPPQEDGLPNKKNLAAAAIAAKSCGVKIDTQNNKFRVFAIGGAHAIAAFAYGTETVPCADVIAGPGNRFVAAAKRYLYGQVGIDFIAGPSDVLVISDGSVPKAADLAAADMIAQAEHDPDARARALVPNTDLAEQIAAAVEKRLETLPTAAAARASFKNGGLIVVYQNREEAICIANKIAPEHLELQTADNDNWIPYLKNYGSLFIGDLAVEALGDYSAGINHTLPTSGSARFTGGLSVRHFLKTVTTLRCSPGEGFKKTQKAAEIIARAEGLEGHALSAACRV
ncbi:MAG: histidinol dehydrogenase [Treponema sp.]|nr:histidinol dehydrogenase [Treponema sp.]